MESMLAVVLKHGEWGDTDVLTLIWLAMAFLLSIYLFYNAIASWVFEQTTVSVKLSLHVRRNTFPLCAKCAGGSLRNLWQTFDFSFSVPIGEPARIQFFNNFRGDPEHLSLPPEAPSAVKRVEIHDCGGIDDILFEVLTNRGPVKLLCLPSTDYANIVLEEEEGFFIRPSKLMKLIWIHPRIVYVGWGKLVLGRNCSFFSPRYWSPLWSMGKSL